MTTARRGFLWCASFDDDRRHAHGKNGILFGVRLCTPSLQVMSPRWWRKHQPQPRRRCARCRELANDPKVRAAMAVRL